MPTQNGGLFAARQRELAGGGVFADYRTSANRRVSANGYGRYQGAVRANKGAVADLGLVLVRAIIIASDRAGADIDRVAEHRVTQVTQVIGFAINTELGVFGLDKIANMRAAR